MDQRVVRLRVTGRWRRLAVQQRLKTRFIEFRRQRPPKPLARRPLYRIRHRALRHPGRRRDLLVTELRLKFEAQNLFDLAHGTPFGWHRLPRGKNRGAYPAKCKFQRKPGFIPDEGDRPFRDRDRGFRLKPEIGHLQSESAVTFGRNDRSRSNGISGQLGPEYARTRLGA